jgi:hypothetical protein
VNLDVATAETQRNIRRNWCRVEQVVRREKQSTEFRSPITDHTHAKILVKATGDPIRATTVVTKIIKSDTMPEKFYIYTSYAE